MPVKVTFFPNTVIQPLGQYNSAPAFSDAKLSAYISRFNKSTNINVKCPYVVFTNPTTTVNKLGQFTNVFADQGSEWTIDCGLSITNALTVPANQTFTFVFTFAGSTTTQVLTIPSAYNTSLGVRVQCKAFYSSETATTVTFDLYQTIIVYTENGHAAISGVTVPAPVSTTQVVANIGDITSTPMLTVAAQTGTTSTIIAVNDCSLRYIPR